MEGRFICREQLLHEFDFQFPQISHLLKKTPFIKQKSPSNPTRASRGHPQRQNPWIYPSSTSANIGYDLQNFSSALPTTSKESPGHPPPDSPATSQHSHRAQPVPCARALSMEEFFQVEAPKYTVEAALWLEKGHPTSPPAQQQCTTAGRRPPGK